MTTLFSHDRESNVNAQRFCANNDARILVVPKIKSRISLLPETLDYGWLCHGVHVISLEEK